MIVPLPTLTPEERRHVELVALLTRVNYHLSVIRRLLLFAIGIPAGVVIYRALIG